MNMKLKKILSLFTILCVTLTMTLTVYSEKANTANDKAGTLNKLSVLKGDGIDFNLDGQLRRSEAATFIVRLMGKEEDVLANKAKWSVTKYADVEKSAWYAPYIGYCSQLDIISGFPDGSYKPNDNISEKAFLKLVLVVLGYEYNTHFTWDNVFTRAYDVGLVKDYTYQSKEADDLNYKRRSVVEVLYNSLQRPNRETKTTILENLIEMGVVDRKVVADEGLVKDTIITEISSISVIDTNTIKVKFNEEIEKLTAGNIIISELENMSSKLTVAIRSQSKDELTIATSGQVPEMEYTITILDVTDKEGNINDITGAFSGYKSIEVNSEFFRINRIEAVSKNVVNVFFTQPINMNIELPMYYEILQGSSSYVKGSFQSLSVKVLAPYDNAVTIFLKDKSFNDGENYTLKISGDLTSAYGSKLNNGSGDSMSFLANGAANEEFYVVNVVPLNKRYVKVQYNKDFDVSSAEINTNYTIKDSNGFQSVVGRAIVTKDGLYKNKEVILQIAPSLDSSKQYELVVNNVYDSFRQMKVEQNSKHPFSGNSSDVDSLAIVNVFAEDKGTISVYFNKPLNAVAAIDSTHYSIVGTNSGYVSNPANIHVYYDINTDPYMVKLFISGDAIAAPNTFKLVVGSMPDYFGDITGSSVEFAFSGSGNDNVKPFMVDAKIIASDIIKVTFNEEILLGGVNIMPMNYSLEYKDGDKTIKKTPSSVNSLNNNTLLMKFNDLDISKVYTLKYTNMLTDYSGVNSRPASDSMNGIGVYPGN